MLGLQRIEPLAKQRLFAIIHMFGIQRRITEGDLFYVDSHLPLECGEKLKLNKCLILGGRDFTLVGRPLIEKEHFSITASVVEKTLTDHRCFLRHIPRNFGIKKMFYQSLPRTVLRVNEIKLHSLPDC